MLLRVVLLAAAAAAVLGSRGVDVSSATYIDHFKCLKSAGYSFAIIRCYESVGRPDPECPHTIFNAWDGGMTEVDIYMFPDPAKGDPHGQLKDMVDYLAKFKIHTGGKKPATFGKIWLDIEGPQYWHRSQSENREFFDGLVTAGKDLGQSIGVYTSQSQWDPIMGSWAGGSAHPLWYAHYDNWPSFGDFHAFGGWSKPHIKQYRGTTSLCSTSADLNYSTSEFSRALNATASA